MPLTVVQEEILAYVRDHPGCTRGAVARATAYGQGDSTIRERMRSVANLLGRGYLLDREQRRRNPGPLARLHLSARGRRALAEAVDR